MTVSDPISDMLVRIRNAQMARHEAVAIPHSKIKEEIAHVLHEEGYIEGYEVVGEIPKKEIHLRLKYVGARRLRRPVITGMKRVSKPGRRIYTGSREIPWVLSGMGTAIVTTPKGIMTGQQARRERVGGEVLCYVW